MEQASLLLLLSNKFFSFLFKAAKYNREVERGFCFLFLF